ncbi:unnamed protein product [Gulo gulo]|uniref:Uncharacterized protein n=1 Tax=Gulo gulo TaxID=48420 RepID=A0A9X9M249_GULGU|nr:unnamed protein product [Gulo gulo]
MLQMRKWQFQEVWGVCVCVCSAFPGSSAQSTPLVVSSAPPHPHQLGWPSASVPAFHPESVGSPDPEPSPGPDTQEGEAAWARTKMASIPLALPLGCPVPTERCSPPPQSWPRLALLETSQRKIAQQRHA